jgi:hypothetical protein
MGKQKSQEPPPPNQFYNINSSINIMKFFMFFLVLWHFGDNKIIKRADGKGIRNSATVIKNQPGICLETEENHKTYSLDS